MGKTKAAAPKKADNKLAVKKGADKAAMKPKKTKADKDPNKPKRPPSAFFVFMEEFRKQFKEKNPNNKSVAAVGKAAGAKWKSLTEAEKAPYVNKANKKKAEYTKMMDNYSKRGRDGVEEENESDKSKSEVNDEDEESEDDESGEEDDDE